MGSRRDISEQEIKRIIKDLQAAVEDKYITAGSENNGFLVTKYMGTGVNGVPHSWVCKIYKSKKNIYSIVCTNFSVMDKLANGEYAGFVPRNSYEDRGGSVTVTGTVSKKIELSDEQKSVLKQMHGERVLFVTGGAGTGKSTLLQKYRKESNSVVLAPTGIAALNVNGSTIHSFFRLPFTVLQEKDIKKDNKLVNKFKAVKSIVIDEVSMLRADIMDAIDYTLRLHRGKSEPFGGVQMVFVGDLFQLPPVVRSDEKEFFEQNFGSPYFFSAKVFKAVVLKVVSLQFIFRQNDKEFIRALNFIRYGEPELQFLNSRYNKQADENVINLCTTNVAADGVNRNRLCRITHKEFSFSAQISGKFSEKFYPTSQILRLKKHARVMTIANIGEFRNGDVGKVHKIEKDGIHVIFDRGLTAFVKNFTWEIIQYKYNSAKRTLTTEVTGSFTQLPLKLAWAVTIHKSQGLTLDKAVINLGNRAFAHGQTYVALSRVRSIDGMYLKRPIEKEDIICDKSIIDFFEQNGIYR